MLLTSCPTQTTFNQTSCNTQTFMVVRCLLLVSMFEMQGENWKFNKAGNCYQFYIIFNRPKKAYSCLYYSKYALKVYSLEYGTVCDSEYSEQFVNLENIVRKFNHELQRNALHKML